MRPILAIAMATLTLGLVSPPMQGQMRAGDVPALQTIQMVDSRTGWAVIHGLGGNRLLRTTDGGSIWKDITPVISPGRQIRVHTAAVLTSLLAWVASEPLSVAARIFRTTDGGHTWRSVTISDTEGVNSIQFIDAHNGWLLSIEGTFSGSNAVAIYHSTDGGESWVKISYAAPRVLDGVIMLGGYKKAATFLDATTGWITGYDLNPGVLPLFVTHDSGRTWQSQKLPLPSGISSWYSRTLSPRFFTARDGVVPVFYTFLEPSSYAPTGSVVVFYATNDRGMTWTFTTPLSVARETIPVDFVDSKHGWVADGDALYVTSDGGRQWMTVRPPPPFAVVRHLDFVSPSIGWAVRETFPGLLKTLDGGRTWTPVIYTISR